MIVIYEKMSRKEIDKAAKEAIKGITKFFEDNPKRRICKAELFYGQVVKVRKNHIKEDVLAAAEQAKK